MREDTMHKEELSHIKSASTARAGTAPDFKAILIRKKQGPKQRPLLHGVMKHARTWLLPACGLATACLAIVAWINTTSLIQPEQHTDITQSTALISRSDFLLTEIDAVLSPTRSDLILIDSYDTDIYNEEDLLTLALQDHLVSRSDMLILPLDHLATFLNDPQLIKASERTEQ